MYCHKKVKNCPIIISDSSVVLVILHKLIYPMTLSALYYQGQRTLDAARSSLIKLHALD